MDCQTCGRPAYEVPWEIREATTRYRTEYRCVDHGHVGWGPR